MSTSFLRNCFLALFVSFCSLWINFGQVIREYLNKDITLLWDSSFADDEGHTFSESRVECQSYLGTDLASFRNQAVVSSYYDLKEQGPTPNLTRRSCWIGLRIPDDSDPYWVDGSVYNLTESVDSDPGQTCGYMHPDEQSGIGDWACSGGFGRYALGACWVCNTPEFRDYSITVRVSDGTDDGSDGTFWFRLQGNIDSSSSETWTDWFSQTGFIKNQDLTWTQTLRNVGVPQKLVVLTRSDDAMTPNTIVVNDVESPIIDQRIETAAGGSTACSYIIIDFTNNVWDDFTSTYVGSDSVCPYNDDGLPTNEPTKAPTVPPTSPSTAPTLAPTVAPSNSPTLLPTAVPSNNPTSYPSSFPTGTPSSSPTLPPTAVPSINPSTYPSSYPSSSPSFSPSSFPTATPSTAPTGIPISVYSTSTFITSESVALATTSSQDFPEQTVVSTVETTEAGSGSDGAGSFGDEEESNNTNDGPDIGLIIGLSVGAVLVLTLLGVILIKKCYTRGEKSAREQLETAAQIESDRDHAATVVSPENLARASTETAGFTEGNKSIVGVEMVLTNGQIQKSHGGIDRTNGDVDVENLYQEGGNVTGQPAANVGGVHVDMVTPGELAHAEQRSNAEMTYAEEENNEGFGHVTTPGNVAGEKPDNIESEKQSGNDLDDLDDAQTTLK